MLNPNAKRHRRKLQSRRLREEARLEHDQTRRRAMIRRANVLHGLR